MIIFDGLDELLNLLPENSGKHLTRALWRVLPVEHLRGKRRPGCGKLLISCRSHFFRSLDEARNHCIGEQREYHGPAEYRVWQVLPFDRDQVRRYLAAVVPDRDPDAILEMFDSIHNLSELASRPYTLSLITDQIAELEARRANGESVNICTLYDGLIGDWLNRDSGKHRIGKRHKRQMMQALAATLWQSGERQISGDNLDDWLLDFLERYPRVERHYRQQSADVLMGRFEKRDFPCLESKWWFSLCTHVHVRVFPG